MKSQFICVPILPSAAPCGAAHRNPLTHRRATAATTSLVTASLTTGEVALGVCIVTQDSII